MNRYNSTAGTAVAEPTQEMRDTIVDWLKDAYAMERGLESSLQKQSQDDDLSPSVRQRANAHLEETKRHAELMRAALQSLDADTSILKTTLGVAGQGTKGMFSQFASDQQIKDLLDAYMMEHFEIACYTALEAAAQRAGFQQVVDLCERIIPDEERMAQAIYEALPNEVSNHLFKEAHAVS